ncbi:GNAT family N-acetyltransferase [Pseudohongiella sp.]|uniref:N-acetyltransferase domain-containing protein n=1 Tax=marine sediment metagenome TaxID=412755 RepID=A0A0F9W7A7_9ZZZZ|nr:GNAT family N-acetyltransferase [Pseudohongiella sp.]HDZ09391.1 N-acetyltransferase [Pseudohongiella sp.]HEA63760.1 N-acetyltransferase [Pseudohongiella sp.]
MTAAGHTQPGLSYRKARPREMDWAYRIFKTGMQSYITRTWGWNELFQEHSFFANLPASSFTIASIDTAGTGATSGQRRVDIGGYHLKQKADHLYLEMLLIDPAWQRQGYGSAIIADVMLQANERNLPVRLSVLKINPAYHFYHHLGFVIETQDDIRYRMIRAA